MNEKLILFSLFRPSAFLMRIRWDRKIDVQCYPIPDALNPCEDVMGSQWLRVSVWIVVFLAVLGNIAVLLVLFSNWRDVTVPKFLMSHLAFADLCLGLYLLLIASIDIHSMGEYFNFAFDWQYGEWLSFFLLIMLKWIACCSVAHIIAD